MKIETLTTNKEKEIYAKVTKGLLNVSEAAWWYKLSRPTIYAVLAKYDEKRTGTRGLHRRRPKKSSDPR